MWALLLIAVHINNPNDIPGRVELNFQSQQSCQQALDTLKWSLKFDSFKIVGKCEKKI